MTEAVRNYTPREAAAYLRCSVRQLRRLRASGKLRWVQMGRRVLIRETALEQFIRRAER